MLFFIFASIALIFVAVLAPCYIKRRAFTSHYYSKTKKEHQIEFFERNFGLGQIPELLDSKNLIENYMKYVRRAAAKNQDFMFFNVGLTPFVLAITPRAIKQICVAQIAKFSKTNGSYLYLRDFIGEGLITAEGQLWKIHKALIQPLFSFNCVEQMMVKMYDQTEKKIQAWESKLAASNSNELMVEHFGEETATLTLSIMCDCAFGNFSDDVMRRIGLLWRDIANEGYKYIVTCHAAGRGLARLWYKNSLFKNLEEMNKFVTNLVHEREAAIKKGEHGESNLLSLLLQAREEMKERGEFEQGTEMTDQHVIDETTTFLLAGHETTSTWLQWVFYNLAKYPDVQEKVIKEIDEVWSQYSTGSNQMNYNDMIASMRYTSNVMNEALRLYPPVYILDRSCDQDVKIGEQCIPKGTHIGLLIVGLQRNPNVWKNPEEFDPERWSEERLKEMPDDDVRFGFVPFLVGQRDCAGKLFVQKEAKLIVAMVLQKFRVQLQKGFELELEATFTAKPRVLPINLVKRNH